ncbi:MAG TPA: hypothetical protein VD886_11300 [Herpetosiphonaceae bacterium]|nr:hypothetical protein [Herpetosiphonaceae bacterium]
MKRRLLPAVGAVVLMLVLQLRQPGAAYACSCGILSIDDEFDAADAVLQGEVIDIQPAGEYYQNVIFNVSKNWKGSYRRMVLGRATRGGSCNARPFVKGREYIVLASDNWFNQGDATLYAHDCGSTEEVSPQMLTRLKLIQPELQPLTDGPPAAGPPWGWLALAAAIVAAAIWRWRRGAARPK